MPYKLDDSGLCVVKKDSGESVKCHATHAEAAAHLAALEINVEDAKAQTVPNKGGDADRSVIRVWANPFGGPNNGKDAHGQYFSPRTKFHEDKLPLPPAVYYHGYNPDGTPAGTPDFIGPTIGRGVDPQRGVWYDVALDTQKSDGARRLAATPSDKLRASAGVVPATKRIAANGEILSWMNGEISVFDASATRRPVNDYAVGTHIKALYQKAGIDSAALEMGNSMNPLDVLMGLIQTWWTTMQGGNGAAPAPAAAGDAPNPAAAADAQNKAQPPTAAPVAQPAQTTAAQPPAANAAIAPVAAVPAGTVSPNDLHIHYHAPDANSAGGIPPVPPKKDDKEMTNQRDDSMKADLDAATARNTALETALRGRVVAEADGWSMGLMKTGKMLPAEKPHAVETYVTLTLESENMKSLAPALEHFKLAYELREANGLIGDAATAGLQGAGHDTPDNQKSEKPMSETRRKELLASSLVGQAVLRESAVQEVK